MVYTHIKNIIVSNNTFKSLIFEDRFEFSYEFIIFAIGITANNDIACTSGMTVHENGGILVTPDLLTSAESVYAVGEYTHNLFGDIQEIPFHC